MDLVLLVLILVLVGFLVYLLTTKVPMPPHWATAIQIIALLFLVLWLLTRFAPHVPNLLP